MRTFATAALVFFVLFPDVSAAQDDTALSAWQAEKCHVYRQSWEKALGFFDTENVSQAFISQNETFMASGCTAQPVVCAQSRQELDIANALTIQKMNAGAASTFMPFRCQNTGTSTPFPAATGAAPDSQLCRSQLDPLSAGEKFTAEEAAVFEAQCARLELKEQDGKDIECAL
ncbi:hypothetical protein ABIB57_002117 [Devosia sp. UYZn731]|uniref:hypothetical protein n=1 Tax=Devosia sp. UYZn731 TaxID=3156345 RepID=UPI00339902B6